jgi:probable rRNA maturation factor
MLTLHLSNTHGPRGVPTRRSFEQWATAAVGKRRRGALEVNLHIADVEYARELNAQFRGKHYATNVLSFPYQPMPGEKARALGDLLICAAVVEREAAEQGKPVRAHYAHLTVHGVLHLLGYDHERSPDEAAEMEAIERQVLETLGFPDPYTI